MDPADNATLARFLVSPPRRQPSEACYRGGCGRAYYAAFGVARDALESIPIPISQGWGAHGEVVRHLARSNDPDVQAAAGTLDDLRTWRNEADYDIGRRAKPGGFSAFRAQAAVVMGHEIIEAVGKAKRSDPRLFIP